LTTVGSKEQDYFVLAFTLAFYIHVNKEVAFFVAEDAVDGLASALGRQGKNRRPSDGLRGFLKWGERARPVRKTLWLSEAQMLQWLVYRQSELWERETERGEGLYLPTEEDMIVRYVEHLVFLTLRRGSFYVTLAVGSLLHQFSRREVRLFYDILTQSDPARMKDASYIGKQRLEMMEKVSQRFGHMIQTAKSPGDETQFVTRPLTPLVIDLVNESLRRFAPWETTCAVGQGFDVTDIPGLYYSETDAQDEELIEMTRIRAVLDPGCFARFVEGLSKYVPTLPDGDQDRGCSYDSPDERIAVPQFSNFPTGTPRGDRFQPPKLTREDFIRLRRTLDARARRRKDFTPRQLCVYVDDLPTFSFDPKTTRRVRLVIGTGAGVIEVRGRDAAGELTLATFFLREEEVSGGEFGGSVVQPGGQQVTVRLKPAPETGGAVGGAQLEVTYAERGLLRAIFRLAGRVGFGVDGAEKSSGYPSDWLSAGRYWQVTAGAAVALVIAALTVILWRLPPTPPPREQKPPEQSVGAGGEGQVKEEEQVRVKPPVISATPSPTPKSARGNEEAKPLLARATWSTDREAALHAVAVEPTRGEARMIDLSRGEAKIVLSFPLYDEGGHPYSRYRLKLSTGEAQLWQQTLRAPKASLTGYAHILNLSLYTRLMPETGTYDLRVEGRAQGVWRQLGRLALVPKNQ
jgi:hypothetical protein